MRLHRFFIEQKIGEEKNVVIRDIELFHQLKNVFRYNVGSQVILLDNSGFEFGSIILSFAKGELKFEIFKKTQGLVPKRNIHLFQSLIKKDNFEWVLEKGTELGVSNFTPLLSERSEKKGLNMERGRKIIKEASEQSGRGELPELHELRKLPELLENPPENAVVFDSSGSPFSTFNFTLSTFNLLIGPEGGWGDKELQMFREKSIPIYSLGKQTLRAETAAIVVSTMVLLDF